MNARPRTCSPGLCRTGFGAALLISLLLLAACESVESAENGADDVATEPTPDGAGVDGSNADVRVEDVTPDTGPTPDDGASVDVAPPECVPSAETKVCNDFLSCTVDACIEGACVHTPVPGCCVTGDACDDGIACTTDSCNTIQNRCQHVRSSNACCVTTADCDDLDACTVDECVANQCVHPKTNECQCQSGITCDDGNACTVDQCDLGICDYALSGASCCKSAADCDDGDTATTDGCQVGLCTHQLEGACATDADCVAGNACVSRACVEGTCVTSPVPGCCLLDVECADALADTVDRCAQGRCVHDTGTAQACANGCAAPNACLTATCVNGPELCSLTPAAGPECCTADADCGEGSSCTDVRCVLGVCESQPTGAEQVVWSESFDSGAPLSFTVSGGSGAVTWQLAQTGALSQPGALYYGQLPQLDYDVGVSAGVATAPPIALPAGSPSLRFARNLAIEPGQVNDKVWLTVTVTGQAPVTIWDKTWNAGPGVGWKDVQLDLSAYAGKTVTLSLHFDSVDGKNNGGQYNGAWFDDFRVTTPCP
ncbi:MAG: hypothetical protein IV100_22800 [Myxococcales bacterium]|nr:hypothetical protein [Myxococcales bacterium]